MPLAVIVGMPRELIKRINHYLQLDEGGYLDGWTVEYIPARRNDPEIFESEIQQARLAAARHQNSHVLAVSKQDKRARQVIASGIREFFRFRFLDTRLLPYIPDHMPDFFSGLNAALAEEEVWADMVKPQDLRSPLLLPRFCFDASSPHCDIWELAEQYGETGNIEAAAAALQRFESHHWSDVPAGGRRWVDDFHRVFDHSGQRHAVAPFPRDWKYSYNIEKGFHFDVSRLDRRTFFFRDAQNYRHVVVQNGYLNVDPHGYVRGR